MKIVEYNIDTDSFTDKEVVPDIYYRGYFKPKFDEGCLVIFHPWNTGFARTSGINEDGSLFSIESELILKSYEVKHPTLGDVRLTVVGNNKKFFGRKQVWMWRSGILTMVTYENQFK